MPQTLKKLITRELSFDINGTIELMSQKLRTYLGISIEEQFSWETIDDALENWRKILNDFGVYVFKDAFREPNYHGFCLYDDEFPIIYINNSTTKSRQIFTIFHELSHLIFHTSGVDVIDDDYINTLPANSKKIEIICNKFSSNFLVPENIFNKELEGKEANINTAEELANRYCVSREVIYRKFLDRGLVSQADYYKAVKIWNKQMGAKGTGGDYYNNQMAYLGRTYLGVAFERFYQSRFDIVQLADYLNIKPKNVPVLEARFLKATTK